MTFDDLDKFQKTVITHLAGSADCKVLVIGGPGSGKTTTALWAAKQLLENPETPKSARVLFLTFSRSAVSQIVIRAAGVLAGIEERVEILTFHALAYRIICAFGRYDGIGTDAPRIQSEARRKLLGTDNQQFTYDELIPRAVRILSEFPLMRQLFIDRWPMIICDEVQDTNKTQWDLLESFQARKVLCLGDLNQLIYTFISGVSPQRFDQVKAWCDTEIPLSPSSHRDPSGAIPAMAEAIRRREFEHEAVSAALETGRLIIVPGIEHNSQTQVILGAITAALTSGAREVGVFLHANAEVADLAHELDQLGVEHALIGISEAHAEALTAMNTACLLAAGLATSKEFCESLAVFLTAATRGSQAPQLAYALIGRAPLPGLIEQTLQELETNLVSTSIKTIEQAVLTATQVWPLLRITSGNRPWRRAVEHFVRLLKPFRSETLTPELLQSTTEIIKRARNEALVDLDYSEYSSVRLMNFHQTKGREADVVIHAFRDDDFFGKESEPFPIASKLLNVALSRARKQVIVILPPSPHPLVRPFGSLAVRK